MMKPQMNAEQRAEAAGRHYAGLAAVFLKIAGNDRGENPTRGEMILRLRDLRDARREFMAAAGDCDDAWMSQDELETLERTEQFCMKVMSRYDIAAEDIDAAESLNRMSTGRAVATPQFPQRFDM